MKNRKKLVKMLNTDIYKLKLHSWYVVYTEDLCMFWVTSENCQNFSLFFSAYIWIPNKENIPYTSLTKEEI